MASSSSSSPELPVSRSTANGQQSSVQARLHEVLEDLSSRFILNLPEVELASLERVCFQVEQAHWYYEDFIREQDSSLPTMTLKKFSHSLFHVCPFLSHWGDDHEQTFQNFMAYKTRVPVCGAIMLNETWDKCLLVKGWKATSAWSFPKGKINEQEPRYQCAIREVLEETGYDLGEQIKPADVVELSIRDQSLSLYIVPNVPEDFPFETRTRKEISKIAWFKLQDLPTWKRNKPVSGKFYLITPFIGPLKAFLRDHKPKEQNSRRNRRRSHAPAEADPHLSSGDDARQVHDAQDAVTQESSSQSSADHGDPQTPSPLYSEPVIHHATPDDNPPQALNLDSVDPHFARLLSSLSLSASASSVEDIPKSQINGQLPSSIHPPISTAAELVQPGSRSPSQAATIRPPRTPSTIPAVSPPPSHSHSRKPSRAIPSPSPLKHASSDAHLRSLVNGPDRQPSPSARRTAAGLSPYLQRASITQAAIPKQMKYISMLESLAKDSERMTPKIERQQAALAMNGPPLPVREQLGAPGPMNAMYGVREESPVIYSSGPGPSSTAPGFVNQPPPFPPAPHGAVHDPFTVRPHTSNTFHPPYPMPPRHVFNEEQLGGMQPGHAVRPPLGPPMAAPPAPYPPGRMAGPPFPAPQQLPAPQQFLPAARQLNQQGLRLLPPGQLLPSTGYNEPAPLSAPALSPSFNLPRTNGNNAQLLSILNGTAPPRAPTVDPAFVGVGFR
ncbi:DCP2-domain-containing protein [Phanerochaete sordida]|uniref:DCP2-domain-containing protein n=1 Tax=Phanerochaete sordida TaxID=48140 RepID=A0A9P3G1V7_9APHY|nr:DCP2-domain-containing protein [Phanerochaete sordida]